MRKLAQVDAGGDIPPCAAWARSRCGVRVDNGHLLQLRRGATPVSVGVRFSGDRVVPYTLVAVRIAVMAAVMTTWTLRHGGGMARRSQHQHGDSVLAASHETGPGNLIDHYTAAWEGPAPARGPCAAVPGSR